MISRKETILHPSFSFVMYESDYFYSYTNYIPKRVFSSKTYVLTTDEPIRLYEKKVGKIRK